MRDGYALGAQSTPSRRGLSQRSRYDCWSRDSRPQANRLDRCWRGWARSRSKSAAGLVLFAALAGALAGCGGNSSAASQNGAHASSSASSGGCTDAAALKASLEALTQVRPAKDGVPALQAAIGNVKTGLDTAVASASSTLQPQLAQVKSAFAVVETSVTGLTADNLEQKAPSIVVALTQLRTAASALASTLAQNCPGS